MPEHRQLTDAELETLIRGAVIEYPEIIRSNRPLIEAFGREGSVTLYNQRAPIRGRYEITGNSLLLRFGSDRETHRLFFQDSAGGLFVEWPEEAAGKLLAARIKSYR